MSDATILYVVTAVVLSGLVVWVGVVLATTKTRWARTLPAEGVVESEVERKADAG